MGLTEGCRCQRRRIHPRVRPLERHAQLSFGERSDRVERDGRNLVLQALELFGDLGGQNVQPRRHELADLDHQAAELDSQRVEALRDPAQPRPPSPRREAGETDPRQEKLEPPRLHQVERGESRDPAVPGTHAAGVGHRISLTPTRGGHCVVLGAGQS